MIAVDMKTKKVVNIGAEVTNFRGERGMLRSLERANEMGRDGKINVDGRTFYARVWGLEVRSLNSDTPTKARVKKRGKVDSST